MISHWSANATNLGIRHRNKYSRANLTTLLPSLPPPHPPLLPSHPLSFSPLPRDSPPRPRWASARGVIYYDQREREASYEIRTTDITGETYIYISMLFFSYIYIFYFFYLLILLYLFFFYSFLFFFLLVLLLPFCNLCISHFSLILPQSLIPPSLPLFLIFFYSLYPSLLFRET